MPRAADGSGNALQSPMIRMRQVEQRARPPQTLAWGTLLRRLAFEHAQPPRHPHRPAVAVGQADHAAAAFHRGRGRPCQQHEPDQAEITDQEIIP